MEALSEANRVRFARADLKKEIRSLPRAEAVGVVCEVIENADEVFAGMGLMELFGSINGVGEHRANQVVQHMRFPFRSPRRRISELTGRQRGELSRAVREVCGG